MSSILGIYDFEQMLGLLISPFLIKSNKSSFLSGSHFSHRGTWLWGDYWTICFVAAAVFSYYVVENAVTVNLWRYRFRRLAPPSGLWACGLWDPLLFLSLLHSTPFLKLLFWKATHGSTGEQIEATMYMHAGGVLGGGAAEKPSVHKRKKKKL